MKKIPILIALLLLSATPLLAQAPSAMNYQGIARDASGALLQNTALALRISILQGSADGESAPA